MADAPITREEQYLAYLNGESDSIPTPVTRVEKYLHKLCVNGVGVYSDSDDVTFSYSVKNKTTGIDITSQFTDLFKIKHIKIGKVHFLEIIGGKKIYSTTTAEYQVGLTVIIPTYFSSGFELNGFKGSGISADIIPSISLGTNQMTLSISYVQPNSTSQYSPDTVYQMSKVLMFIEKE